MISEPELIGDDGEPVRIGATGARPDGRFPGDGNDGDNGGDGGNAYGRDGRDGRDRGDVTGGVPAGAGNRWGRRRRLWALGGALGASVLWAAGLSTYRTLGPDLDGYRTTEALCAEAPLTALVTTLGKRGATSYDDTTDHDALSRGYCSVQLGEGPATYEVALRYELHKKTDPDAEFEAREGEPLLGDGPSPSPLPGLGERAYFSQGGGIYPELVVLDGQAVLAMSVNVYYEYDHTTDEAQGPDDAAVAALAGVREFMVEDMKTLMRRLRTAPSPTPPSPPASPPSPSASPTSG
ncbi:hypothetical protein [Streptomyces sp. TRM49041]|uniref:hypothetical protein n=1 Tax=Streptomyces sp. TRM49041 TaxID=2603216 RepID=UPI0016568974|nr:hypothetical protein [Streptomyces sp. TRM49041]